MKIRQSIALLLAALLLVSHGGHGLHFIWYSLSNDSFESRFCKNIEEPELACKGQCFFETVLAGSPREAQSMSATLPAMPSNPFS
ncbi:MAG: hypothetical protein R2795_19830 [Saprospiraceae bacterium]